MIETYRIRVAENGPECDITFHVHPTVVHLILEDKSKLTDRTLTNGIEDAVVMAWRALPIAVRNEAEKNRATLFIYQKDEDGTFLVSFSGKTSRTALAFMTKTHFGTNPSWRGITPADFQKMLDNSHSDTSSR